MAGLLGLTNLNGFALYLAVSFGTGALYTLVNCNANPSRYFLKPSEPVLSGTVGNCFPFILFWTREFPPPPPSRYHHCFRNLDTDSRLHTVFYSLVYSKHSFPFSSDSFVCVLTEQNHRSLRLRTTRGQRLGLTPPTRSHAIKSALPRA